MPSGWSSRFGRRWRELGRGGLVGIVAGDPRYLTTPPAPAVRLDGAIGDENYVVSRLH
jgi:hypothetical protein